jgi:hypothetical protein
MGDIISHIAMLCIGISWGFALAILICPAEETTDDALQKS